VLVVLVLIAVMAITGLMMKYTVGDVGLARYIHNNMSVVFTIVLVIMAVTGLVMYVYPWYARRKRSAPAAPQMQGKQ